MGSQAQRLKRLPGMQEARVRSLSREDPLEKEMAAHSSTLAWEIPWTEEPGRSHKGISIYRPDDETKEIQSHFTPELPKIVATAPTQLF